MNTMISRKLVLSAFDVPQNILIIKTSNIIHVNDTYNGLTWSKSDPWLSCI